MTAELDLTGRIAVVTGGGRGIGRAVCLALAERGCRVAAAARSGDQLREVAAAARGPGEVVPLPTDVSQDKSVRELFAAVAERFGRLDVLVNNAGLGLYGPVRDFAVEDFDRVMAVNLRGTFLCCREAMRLMVSQGAGFIINVSSVVGFKGYPRQGAYTAAKHGIMGLTKALAVEAQEAGIRVSAILPGGVDTEMVRRSRPDLDPSVLMRPEDVAHAVLFLLSLSQRAHVDQIYIRRRTSRPF